MTETTMVERVARAIWDARAVHFGEPEKTFVKDERWELCLSYARAAIEAMKNPPDAVLDAMNPSGRYASLVIPEAWNDAISAALSDRPAASEGV